MLNCVALKQRALSMVGHASNIVRNNDRFSLNTETEIE